MIKPTINTINTYLQRRSQYQQVESQQPIAPHVEREPGSDDAGISGTWPPKAWSLKDWVHGATGDFHVRATLTGDYPISRGF